jgi:hypothetical protein
LCLAPAALAEGSRADELFRAGNQAFAAGDARAAYDAYREAWSLRKSFDIACNLGRTEAELSLSRDAAEHLDYCIRTYPASSREDLRDARARFQELFAEVRSRVAALRIESKPQGAEVTVDGARYGTTPLAGDVFVDPGRHRVRAELLGFRPEEREVEVAAGASIVVSFPLARDAAPVQPSTAATPGPAAPPNVVSDRRTATLRTTVVVSGAALTLVATGVGAGFAFDADATRGRIDRVSRLLRERSDPSACAAENAPPDCKTLADEVDHERRARELSDVFFAASAITSLATVAAWFLLPDDAPESKGGARVMPWVSSASAGVSLTGSY